MTQQLNPEGVEALASLLIEQALDDTVRAGLEAARRINSRVASRGTGRRSRIASTTENVVYYGQKAQPVEG